MKPLLSLLILFVLTILTSLQVKASSACPDNCNYNGDCNPSNKCLCYDGWFDSTCNVQATFLQPGAFMPVTLASNTWAYFYYPLRKIDQDIQINWRADGGQFIINVIAMNEHTSVLPDSDDPSRVFTAEGTVRTIDVSSQIVKMFPNGKLAIGIKNVAPVSQSIGVQLNFAESSAPSIKALSITLGVSIAIVFTLASLMWCIYKRKRLEARQIPVVVGNGLDIQVQPLPIENEKVPICLTRAELHKFFPKQAYNELKSPFNQTTCAVCLEEFQKDALCHQLYCEHIFHDICIEKWLMKHDNCPDCRKLITVVAITEFLKRSLVEDEKKKQIENQQENPNSNQVVIEVNPTSSQHAIISAEERDSLVGETGRGISQANCES